VDVFSRWVSERLVAQQQAAAIAVVPLGRRAAKALLAGLAFIALLHTFGVNVTALLAGLGVGGLAVALAAQKSIENLFGGVTVIADQPVRVGDFFRFGDQVGTVEDIGLRSTRVRTLDRTLITIPNAEFSQMKLENFAKRDRIRIYAMIGLRYETTPDQLRYVLVEIRKLLYGHPKIHADPARIRFVGFGAYSLDLELFAYVPTTDWNELLAVREDLFLRIIDVIDASGTGFAFPSQTLYLEKGEGVDAGKTDAAEAQVRAWREKSELPLPYFPQEVIAQLDDSLDYPPQGSAGRKTA
jgi:MscS family membrane protein